MTGLTAEQRGENDVFDIGFGPMVPDQEIMRTGRVAASAYHSADRLAAEKRVFRKSWLNVARDEEIPKAGDWLTFDLAIGDTSILVVRGKDGRVRAFHNMCTHRGTKLAWGESGHAGQFVCPYHAWTFDTDGRLRGVPASQCFPHVDRDASGLTPIAVDIWAGFIFVNLDPTPGIGLREWLGPVARMLDGAPFADYPLACRLRGTMKANWKLYVESQSEAYHVSTLHSRTVKDFIHCRERPFGDYVGLESLGAHRRATSPRNPGYGPDPRKPFQSFAFGSLPHLFLNESANDGVFSNVDINKDKVDYWGVELYQIFPNFGLNLSRNGFWCTFGWPLTEDTGIWEARYYFQAPATRRERMGTEYSLLFNRDTLMEDVICAEQQQAMLASGARDHIQFGEIEYVLRHEAAVWEAVIDRMEAPGLSRIAPARIRA